MTTKYRLTSLSAENCAVEIQSKMQELCFFQLKSPRLSTLFHQKTKKKTRPKKQSQKKLFFFTSLDGLRMMITSKGRGNSCNMYGRTHTHKNNKIKQTRKSLKVNMFEKFKSNRLRKWQAD